MRKFIEEFKAFALRGNVMDMAVGVIIGGAFSGIVTALTDNFINPILNVCTGHAAYTLQDVAGFASAFISSVVNFIIMAFILFCLMKVVNKAAGIGKKKEDEAPCGSHHESLPLLQKRNPPGSDPLRPLHFPVGFRITIVKKT